MRGRTVTVLRPVAAGTDRLGNPVFGEPAEETVENVLVVPGASSDMDASRPEGVHVAFTLHFPKTYTSPLEGCEVVLPAPWTDTYRVIGEPFPYPNELTPTPWHMAVELEAAHG